MKKILLIILVASIILGLDYYLRKNNLLFYSSGINEKAFINTTWEMSPKEVERANNISLNPTKLTYFNLPDQGKYEYPRVIRMERYKLLEQKESITLWGFKAGAKYAFFDEKLFEYTAFLEGYNSPKMHKKITSALTEKDRAGVAENNKNYIHSTQWETDSERVRYWIFEKKGKGIVKLFFAGIRISYKPMIEKIGKIGNKEHKKLF